MNRPVRASWAGAPAGTDRARLRPRRPEAQAQVGALPGRPHRRSQENLCVSVPRFTTPASMTYFLLKLGWSVLSNFIFIRASGCAGPPRTCSPPTTQRYASFSAPSSPPPVSCGESARCLQHLLPQTPGQGAPLRLCPPPPSRLGCKFTELNPACGFLSHANRRPQILHLGSRCVGGGGSATPLVMGKRTRSQGC